MPPPEEETIAEQLTALDALVKSAYAIYRLCCLEDQPGHRLIRKLRFIGDAARPHGHAVDTFGACKSRRHMVETCVLEPDLLTKMRTRSLKR